MQFTKELLAYPDLKVALRIFDYNVPIGNELVVQGYTGKCRMRLSNKVCSRMNPLYRLPFLSRESQLLLN
jgi:hypothetical protein